MPEPNDPNKKTLGRSDTGSTAMTDATVCSSTTTSPIRNSSSSRSPPPLAALAPCFGLVSLAYMAPWTALGSLVAYFKARYGPDFFVRLNCAFYLAGLPIALAQQWGDEALDAALGSTRAYLWRNVTALALAAVVLALVDTESVVLALVALLGGVSWLAHGTTTTLAAMFPPAALVWLQTGFRLPELYALAAMAVLDLGAQPNPTHIRLFLQATAALVTVGLVAWIRLVRHPSTRALLKLKDQGGAASTSALAAAPEQEDEIKEGAPLLPLAATASASSSSSPPPSSSPRLVVPLTEAEREFVDDVIRPCRHALFVTVASSIFVSSFLAYVRSPNAAPCICQALYFVRLFSDLLGRPLATLLPRPRWLTSPASLLRAALARLLLAGLFFCYIGLPGFPQSDAFVTALVAVFSLLSGKH